MGTKIQSETYFLRHTSRNYSQDIGTGRWLSNQDEKVLENSRNEDSSSPWRYLMYRYSGHDKAKVKETLLEHEVTFRHQVQELHRLYRRQRELMNGIQDKRQYKFQKNTDSSQSVIFPSYMSSQSAKRTWDDSHFLSSDFMLGRLDPLNSRVGQSHNTVLMSKSSESFNPCGDMYPRKPVHLNFAGGAHMNREETIVEGRSFGLIGNGFGCEDITTEPLQERTSSLFFNNAGKYHISPSDSEGLFLCKETCPNSMPATKGRIFSNKSSPGRDGNEEELKIHGFKFDLSLNVEHKTESRKKRKIFGVEITEEVDESSLVSSDAKNSYPTSNAAGSDTSPFLSSRAFTINLSKMSSSAQGSHGATTSELSWLKLGSCLPNLEFVGEMDAHDSSKSSVSRSELFHQGSLSVHPQLNQGLLDGGAAKNLDTFEAKSSFTSLPDLFEFQDLNNCYKSVNSTELKDTEILKFDSEITNMPENFSHHFFEITERTDIPSKKSHLEMSTKDAEDKKDGHVSVGFPSIEGTSKVDAMDLPTDAIGKKCPTQLPATLNAPDKSLINYTSGLRNYIDLNLSIDEVEAPVEDGGFISLEKPEEPHQYSIKEAAEALVVISSALTSNVASYATCHLGSTFSRLHWLADVVCSYPSDEDGIPDGMDYFEFMTLQLKDLKEETYCYSMSDMEHQKAEETEKSATKRRSSRRGRQQKDFQKDVLPELVSLAKREVVEDLHTLEELFHSTGKTWKSRLSRRNNAKKGRREMKSGESLHNQEASPSRLPLKQKQTGRKLRLGGKSFTGWGKRTTRRLPRKRCSKNLSSSIQQCSS